MDEDVYITVFELGIYTASMLFNNLANIIKCVVGDGFMGSTRTSIKKFNPAVNES